MSPQQLTPAPAGPAQTVAPIPSAAQLAARIQIPRRLPPRYDGQPLQHLSHSSYNRFVLCPEDWRRRYMLGEKSAPSGSMFLGRQVDDAISLYYRHILDHGERLTLDQVKDAFWDGWKAAAEAEREQLGIAWEADLPEDRAFNLGLDAVELTSSELIPHLGEPAAVQRKVEYTLAPGLEWSVLCYLDLETRRAVAGAQLPAVVDYKVKKTPLTQHKADHDFQPAVYLAGRWLEGDPAAQFCFAQIAKPGPRRKQIGASLVTTGRSRGQLRGALVRIAQVARQIVACYERFGPDEPWGFADPSGWKCSERYCEAWASCPWWGGRVSPRRGTRPTGSAVRRGQYLVSVGGLPGAHPVPGPATSATDRSSDATAEPCEPGHYRCWRRVRDTSPGVHRRHDPSQAGRDQTATRCS